MRLIKQNIERDGSGTITLFPEEPEDMVHAPFPFYHTGPRVSDMPLSPSSGSHTT